MTDIVLRVENLRVAFGERVVVDNIGFTLRRGETFALVGESGSGKSMSALAVMGLLPFNATRSAHTLQRHEQNLLDLPETARQRLRGGDIAMIFQDALTALNPVQRIGQQIEEVLILHRTLSRAARKARVIELLQQVELPDPARRYHAYPHQLSGGQRQRAMIAMALAGEPSVLIADEPTTALDVTVQAQILQLLKTLQQRYGMALWLISHDLALVATLADHIAVMQHGRIVETGPCPQFFSRAQHPYTRQLLAALPNIDHCTQRTPMERPPLLRVEDLQIYYPIRKGLFQRVVGHVKAVDSVSFSIQRGKTLALVGESGCGKTTLGKGLLNLLPMRGGQIWLDGVALQTLRGEALRRQRAAIQIVFQDPFASMNPRMLIADIIAEGLLALRPELDRVARHAIVAKLLQQVGLPEDSMQRYPHEFSGGQRQRICIARALAVQPKLVVCDEPTSALDVSVQAQILALLKNLQREYDISYLFITHDLALVGEIADDVAVMHQGRIVEFGPTAQVLTQPRHPYTQTLLAAAPRLQTGIAESAV